MHDSSAILIQDLEKKFGKLKALKKISLSIAEGQIYGLLGPNGAGKTTLIRLLIGSTRPSQGKISVLGYDPTRQKTLIRNRIGYMPQSPALYEDLTARENIQFFGYAHKGKDFSKQVNEVIAFVGLEKRANDLVYKFSGGMKQRVSLACAMVHQPKILFLDEPTTGIDPKLREIFWQHFRDLTRQGVTILVSTHQMNEAMYCDRLAILHEGALLADESPHQLLWNKKAKIRIFQRDQYQENQINNYPQQLPILLQQFGLNPDINRIEMEEETLEKVVLEMINKNEQGQSKG